MWNKGLMIIAKLLSFSINKAIKVINRGYEMEEKHEVKYSGICLNHRMTWGKRVSYIINIIDTEIRILKKVRNSGQINAFISTFNCFVKSNLH